MLRKEDRLKLESCIHLHQEHSRSLHLLYGPLMGKEALYLYEELYALASMPQKIKNHLLIQKISGMSMEAIESARETLEQYLLIKTYYDGTKNAYIYSLNTPKTGMEFLCHDVFGRLYFKKMGKQVYEYMKKNFASVTEDKEGYQDITTSLRSLLSDWQEEEESQFSTMKPKQEELHTNFRFDLFLHGLSTMILPVSERNKETLSFIAQKADLYGIDEKEMQKLVGKSMDLKHNKLDRKKLITYMQKSQKEFTRVMEDPYQLPPVRFLQNKQNGVRVSEADQRLIDVTLSETYHLKPEVINVLIEYVLDRCHQTFRKAYVEKVAATWVRLGIDTKEKALETIQNEGKETKQYRSKSETKELPKWYTDQDSVPIKEEDLDEDALMEKLRKLGVNHG